MLLLLKKDRFIIRLLLDVVIPFCNMDEIRRLSLVLDNNEMMMMLVVVVVENEMNVLRDYYLDDVLLLNDDDVLQLQMVQKQFHWSND